MGPPQIHFLRSPLMVKVLKQGLFRRKSVVPGLYIRFFNKYHLIRLLLHNQRKYLFWNSLAAFLALLINDSLGTLK